MATKRTLTLTDDLDGSTADVTISYTWRGKAYEIDLSNSNAQEFQDALAPYLVVSREAGRTPGRTRRPRTSAAPASTRSAPEPAEQPPTSGQVDQKAVRAWARANSIEVSSRGRLNRAVVAQYQAANGQQRLPPASSR